jgi:hypothetical protein
MMMAKYDEQHLHQDDQRDLSSLQRISCFFSREADQDDTWLEMTMMQQEHRWIWAYFCSLEGGHDRAFLLWQHFQKG